MIKRVKITEEECLVLNRLRYLTTRYKTLLQESIEYNSRENIQEIYMNNYYLNYSGLAEYTLDIINKYNLPMLCPFKFEVNIPCKEIRYEEEEFLDD